MKMMILTQQQQPRRTGHSMQPGEQPGQHVRGGVHTSFIDDDVDDGELMDAWTADNVAAAAPTDAASRQTCAS